MDETEASWIVQEQEAGMRLDQLLTAHFHPLYSRAYFQQLIDEGNILLNGRPVKKREKPQQGDEIDVAFVVYPEMHLVPEAIPLEILYEDDHLLAIAKPSGLVVHPAPGHPRGTVVNALLHHCQQQLPGEASSLRPGIVHRLDKETSGVLLAAKTQAAHRGLVHLFSQRKIQKEYLALCLGNPGNKEVLAPIGRHPIYRQKMAVVLEKGKEACSRITTLASDGKRSLLLISPQTGRTHQIRVHCQSIHTPILGDMLYGQRSINEQWKIPRLQLHASCLKFLHPIEGRPLVIQAAPPQDMHSLIRRWFPNHCC